jgi:hypothetical protein
LTVWLHLFSTTCPADPADALAWSFQLSNFHDSSASIPMYGWLVCQICDLHNCVAELGRAKEQWTTQPIRPQECHITRSPYVAEVKFAISKHFTF